MSKLSTSLFLILCVSLLSGCGIYLAQRPDQLAINNANYGPFPTNYQSIVETEIGSLLKDPDSATYQYTGTPWRDYNRIRPLTYGWVVCGKYNAKNSYGGYVGYKPFYAQIHSGKIVKLHFDSIAKVGCETFHGPSN